MDSQFTVQAHPSSKGLFDCPGYRYSATAVDIRDNQSGQLDIALIVGNTPLKSAAVFTQNDVTVPYTDSFCDQWRVQCRKHDFSSANNKQQPIIDVKGNQQYVIVKAAEVKNLQIKNVKF